MKLQPLEKHIERLANLQETKKLIVSCYLNLGNDDLDWRTIVPKREAEILDSFSSSSVKSNIRGAFSTIKRWLNSNLSSNSKGVALFARGGDGDLFVPMQFETVFLDIGWDTGKHFCHIVGVAILIGYSESQILKHFSIWPIHLCQYGGPDRWTRRIFN